MVKQKHLHRHGCVTPEGIVVKEHPRVREKDIPHTREELLRYPEDETKPDNLDRFALYRVLAREVGLGEGISTRKDDVAERFRAIGDKYMDLTTSILELPEEIQQEYENAEDRYLKLVEEIYRKYYWGK